MLVEQRKDDALLAEAEACGVNRRAVLSLKPIDLGEVRLVRVERGDRGRLVAGERREDLELQFLLTLAAGEDPAGAAEERV